MTEAAGQVFAVVAGGGTAGHVLPALAVADALVAAGHRGDEIHYLGTQRGIETRLVPPTGLAHTFLDVVGLQRRLTRRNLAFVPKLWRATRAARALLANLRPRVVVSVGGYGSLPAVLAARRLHIPIVVVSYDHRPGRASQLAARWAAACAVAFPDSPLPRATLTGAPVRQAVLDVDRGPAGRLAARAALGIPAERFLVAVIGGSLGSGLLNEAMLDYVDQRSDDATLAVRHVVGERFVDDVRSAHAALGEPPADGALYQVIGFDEQIPDVYAAADLLVGRGGASTVHEVAAVGIPSVLVPWSGAADDHQTGNVEWLARQGATVMLAEARAGELPSTIERLRHDPAARERLATAARAAGEVHRRGALAALVERVALA
jgi:UDP-N-acetylglucosamine--N-acetylmuramyl-(pentapeptide) pyrophosphoryl-undecaprenol N-acetylglucosamine transferase